ncbi:MAG: Asp-tRNA(Asn)/Glu-tRNA(Gln) amidotransferase subunit GatC [Burkholderiales bacterium]|nr:Asp-tRNA(Asn)/Glu-tRNA(Gln) amidotransferase subunit GatC [Burkholderiales bacterium]
MSLNLDDVKRIANLAKLELTSDQMAHSLEQLNNIFALAEDLKAVNTEGVTPLSHPIAALMPELALRLREDAVTEQNQREAFQTVAPATHDGMYVVPRVVE